MSSKRIFISVANEEHSAFRSQLTDLLRRTQFFDVVIQPEFPHTAADTVRKLDTLIKTCDLTVHIVGRHPGSRANANAVTDFFDHTSRDTFLDKHPKAKALLGDFSQLTYFQWEPWLALHRGKDVLVYGTPGHEAKTFPQRDHFDALYLTRKHAATLLDAEQRCAQIVADVCNHFGILPSGQPEQKIALSRLVSRHTGPESIGEFLGREDELKLLDEAWATPGTNVLSIIAWGGVGKTALLAEWIDRRFVKRIWKNDIDQPDPIFYFDWTFYDQGTRSDDATHAGAASVDSFFDTALRFFGDPEPHLPGKGARLAALIQKQRTLLVLDGLEPMQYPPNHPQAGQITDPDLHVLLATLAQRNPGLCVLTSRQALTGLRRVDRHDLDELPEAIAIRLLQKLGVIGTEADLAAAVRDYFGHALSLIVLGRYLFVKGGDIRLRHTIKLERANERRPETTTRNAWHVLEAYEQWLASPAGRAEDVQALRLTGLFDRPASPDCLDALRRTPAIPSLTDHLVPLDDDAWNAVLHRLHEAHLIQLRYPPRETNSLAPRPEARQVPLDAHPLIREYFAKQLRDKHQAGYQQAHSRLFLHLCDSAPQSTQFNLLDNFMMKIGFGGKVSHKLPSLGDLQPLYQAVYHGCRAGMTLSACDDVYCLRINRGTTAGNYGTTVLGAYSSEITTLSHFFTRLWDRISDGLPDAHQGWLLNAAGHCLRHLGRCAEAVEPLQRGLQIALAQSDASHASTRSANFSEIQMLLGCLDDAIDLAKLGVDCAQKTKNPEWLCWRLATVAACYHQRGEIGAAYDWFAMSETIQKSYQPENEFLYSSRGYQYCELLLSYAEIVVWRTLLGLELGADYDLRSICEDVRSRATFALKLAVKHGWTLFLGLDRLTLARANALIVMANKERNHSDLIGDHLNALAVLRQSGSIEHLPQCLLALAQVRTLIGGSDDIESALFNLDEAQQIAERGPMPLYLADVHLHRARLFHDKAELHRARALIEKHGYWRRKEELEDAEAAAVNW